MSQIFFFGGGGAAEACYPGKIRVVVTLNVSAMFLQLETATDGNNGANVPGSTREYCNLFALAFKLALFSFAAPR